MISHAEGAPDCWEETVILIKPISMDAYQYLNGVDSNSLISEDQFYKAINDFQLSYLGKENYVQRLQRHRNPEEVCNDVLRKLYAYDNAIQERPEMRFQDNTTYGYVPSVIKDLWQTDKHLKSLYRTVQHYCEQESKDFNTIAIHIAEFRAIVRLGARIRRQIRKSKAALTSSKTEYTFDDWLNHRVFNEQCNTCGCVANDSENYQELVKAGKMSEEVFNKILAAQQQAYDYMVACSLRQKEQQFLEQTKNAADRKIAIDTGLERIGKYFNQNITVYNETLTPRKYQSIKWGAKFLLPEQYIKAVEKLTLDINAPDLSNCVLNINNHQITLPSADQLKYVTMEIELRWLTILHGYRSKMQFEEMVNSPDFKALIDKYGAGETERLMAFYRDGLEFAPDRELYINKLIEQQESVMPGYRSSITIRDWTNNTELQIHTGEYKRTGYAWVNGGYNAKSSELHSMTLRNLTLCPQQVPVIQRYGVYVQVLGQLAAGGSIAFFLAFLRKELKNGKEDTTVPTDIAKAATEQPAKWMGGEDKRKFLFEALVEESFIESTPENKIRFMNNQVVKWLADGRSLFYMLGELKKKKYDCLGRYENLTPFIKDNFMDKNGLPFKNVNQNISGMTTANKNAKPRRSASIDEILKKLEQVKL